MAECGAVCEHVHLPLQSGSSRVLKAMRRTYTRERYLALAEKLRAAIPDLAFGTDIIVGFPGETDREFEETLEVVEEVGFDSAFTFVYSPRHGTEAAAMEGQVAHEVKIERMERLVELTQGIAAERNARRVGLVEQVLVEGSSRTDETLLRGRTRRNTMVNFRGERRARRARRRPGRARDLDHAPRYRGRSRGRRAGLGGPDADPHHRLVRPDRDEPRAAPAARRALGLRRRQAPEQLDARVRHAAPGPRRRHLRPVHAVG